jgi:hypothetical protein
MTSTADLAKEAAAWLSAKPELQAFAAYFSAKQAGVKAAAKQASDSFAAELEQAPLTKAISLVRTLDEARRLFGAIPGFMPYPVAMAASRVCQRWEGEDAAAADPLVFRAGFEWNPDLFAQALERDPLSSGRSFSRPAMARPACRISARSAKSRAPTMVRHAFRVLTKIEYPDALICLFR